MIALKKMYGEELLRLALVLSLLKADPNEYLQTETQQIMAGLHPANGTDWSIEQEARTLIRPRQIHPKSLDHILMNYERQLFEELNSLGRYNGNNGRMSSLHTYLVNNVATETVAQSLPDTVDDDVVSDDNVAQEVKISEDDNQEEGPDAVVTLSPDFFHNRSESDIFADIASRSFDVEELLNEPNMITKEEQQDEFNLAVKLEQDDLLSDNAMDDYVPYFTERSKIEIADPESVLDQNIADLQDYGEFFDEAKALRDDFEHLDVKENDDLEKFLLENTPLESPYELTPMVGGELVVEVKRERASTSFTASSSGVSEIDTSSDEKEVKIEPDEGHHSGDELTQEDMDLIEVLWKQDVDMGFCVENPVLPGAPQAAKVATDELASELKRAESKLQEDKESKIAEVEKSLLDEERKEEDPWAGLSYTVDTETGEYVLLGELPRELVNSEESRFDLLEEALNLVELSDDPPKGEQPNEQPEAVEGPSGSADEMLHPAMARHAMPPHHPLAHYHNQRWQDLASLLTIPPPPEQYQYHHHHHHHQQHPHNVSAHSAAASYAPNYGPIPPPPLPEKHPDAYGATAPLDGAYKVESAHHPQQHDGLYYQQSGPELANNSDGFLQSILNDEDLQLMDMAMNEGMYTMRVLDGGPAPHHPPHPGHSTHHMMMTAERDSASDSAVSSMGSERVPSLSDGEWCDAGSDSAQEYHSSKFRPYDSAAAAAYGRERAQPPQKKHHMFGKQRCFQEQPLAPEPARQPSVKYECPEPYELHSLQAVDYARHGLPPHAPLPPTVDLNGSHSSHTLLQPAAPERVRHNHTYSDPRPRPRDKRVRHLTEDSLSDGGSSLGHLTRDEKRAKALGIPLEVQDIINLPMDEFNERLSKHDLSEAQLSLIRDIRRRGKNKVAAQNCRKRKLDQISSLADEVRAVRDRKLRTQRDRSQLLAERQRVKERFAALYRHVFQSLRDGAGRPLSSAQYSLQQAADGSVVLVPRMQHAPDTMNRTSEEEMDRKAKSYDQ